MTFEHMCTRDEIEHVLKIRIRTLEIYQEAMLHKSAVKLYNANRSNERLEFIGDSVLNLIIANYLYMKYPDEDEGFMTKLRTRIVSGQCLSKIAKQMKLQDYIRMNDKALRQGWNNNPRILEDVFEALVGAIFLDQGMFLAQEYVLNKLHEHIQFDELLTDNNYKDMLMRYTQREGHKLPVYVVANEIGPNHNKTFTVQVNVNNNVLGEGSANNKKQAEQMAARSAIICLGV